MKLKGLAILALIVAMCALVAAAAVPPTPFMIYGYVLYENGSACDNPVVNVTNLNTSIEWQANSHTSSNDYYLTLAAGADLNERETLRFDVSSPDGNPLYTTEHAVSSEEINNGGIFNFNFPPGVTAPALVVYTISNRTIKPPQTTAIDVAFSERVSYKIAIENATCTIYEWTGNAKNPAPKLWDGTYVADGTVVPVGDYTVNVTGTNTTSGLSVVNNTEIITVTTTTLPVHNIDTGEDFATIQAAIDDDDTEEGHTITVDPGTYTENVVVNRSISLIGADRNTTIIDGSGYGTVVNVTANNVNISGFTMKNSSYLAGIKLSSDHNTLTDINVMNNDRGIKLWNSNNNTLVKNNISTNNYGILMDYSNNNFFSNNNINKNHHGGILMMNSNNNTITYINANSNYGSGIAIENSNNNTIMNNNANSNRHHSGISIGNSNNNLLINNTATSNYGGICIDNSNNNILTKNNASFNKGPGISLHDSNNNALTENNASFNKGPSISIWHSNNNTLTENNASFGGVGIELWISNNNTLTSNIMNSNEINFDVYGNALSDYIHKIDTSNMVNGKPIYYLVNEQKRIIDSTSNPGYIGIVSSSGIIVRNLTLMNNGQGILFVCVNKSKIENTTISNNGDGIYLHYSNNNLLINNNADSNKIININLEYSNNNILTNNSANLNLNNNGIVLGSSNNNTLSNNSANSNDDDGIRLDGSNNNVLTNNTAKSNWVGIGLYGSCYNILTNNNADSNHVYGIILGSESNNNTLSNNSANTNHWRDGIELMGSSNNTLSNNSANSNSDNGINLDGSNNNILTNNSANRNNKDGVRLSGSNNNTLANNNVNLNNNYGIYLRYSSNNFIFHNNLVNNSNNAYDTNPANNDWHHPALLEGNYWSDYSGLDDGTGTGKHAIAGDGIGDTNIPHPAEDYDFYPFMTESLWTNTKRSLETATGTGSATLSTSGGYFSYVSAVNESSLPSEGKPNRQFPHGFFSFNLTGLTTGQTVNVTIALPLDMPTTTQYWKYHTPEGWYQIPVCSNDGDDILIIQLTDGGTGDDDGVANGLIVDPGAPALPPPAKPDLEITDKFETWLEDGNFTVTYTVKNIGDGNAGASDTTIFIDGVDVQEDPVPVLAPGASYNSTVGPFDCPCDHTLNITVCADNADIVDESNETNNCQENELVCPPCVIQSYGNSISSKRNVRQARRALGEPDRRGALMLRNAKIAIELNETIPECEQVSVWVRRVAMRAQTFDVGVSSDGDKWTQIGSAMCYSWGWQRFDFTNDCGDWKDIKYIGIRKTGGTWRPKLMGLDAVCAEGWG